MSSREFQERLARRARRAGLTIRPDLGAQLEITSGDAPFLPFVSQVEITGHDRITGRRHAGDGWQHHLGELQPQLGGIQSSSIQPGNEAEIPLAREREAGQCAKLLSPAAEIEIAAVQPNLPFQVLRLTQRSTGSSLDLERGTSHHVTFPEPVYSLKRHGNPVYATSAYRFTYTSLVTPASVVDYDLVDRTWTTRKEQEVRGYDRTLYRSARLLVPAADGVKVPVSLVWKDPLVLDGRRARRQ